MKYTDKIPVYFSKKELKNIVDTTPIIIKKWNSFNLSDTSLIIKKLTQQKIPKKIRKPNEWYKASGFFGPDLTCRLPKKIFKYIEKSKNFVETTVNIGTFEKQIYSLNFPKYYKKIVTEGPVNEPKWYLLTTALESVMDSFNEDCLAMPIYFNYASKIQLIPEKDVDVYLTALHKIRPEFADEIRLYLEVN